MAAEAASVPDSHQFGNIIMGGKDGHREENVGTLKVHADGFGWKSRKVGNIVPIKKEDLRSLEWIKIPHAYQLQLRIKGGFVYKFNGFRSNDKDTVKEYCTSKFGLELTDTHLSYKGWNWGQAIVEKTHLSFTVESKLALEVPLTEISQATAQRSEAVVELAADDTALPEDELLHEIRFHIPNSANDEDVEVDGTDAEGFVELIKQRGDLEVAGAALVTFDDVPLQVPRGRYEMELTDKYMKLHGKSNDYKVLYTNVSSLYLLPKPDGYHMALCISLEHPLRQGATMYPHILLQLPREAPLDVEVALTESECSSRFGDKLDKYESGDMPSVVAKVISAFTKKKVIGVKAGGFNGDSREDRSKSIRCSLKAAEGFLYPLDKAFFFIANKPMLLEFDKVASIEFNRVDNKSSAAAARTFDITIHVKDSSIGDVQFVNLQRSDYKELFRFLTSKKLRIKNIANAAAFGEGTSRDFDDEDDPYLATVRREREEAQAAEDDDDDDDDESDDEDFQAKSEESDIDEEYDEGSEDDDERAFKKAKKRKGGDKEADGASDGSGSGDDGSDSEDKPLKPPPKKKAKAEAGASSNLGIMKGKKDAEKKKKRVKKDKNLPKKGQTAYMIWMNNAGRTAAKEELGSGAGIGEIGKWCGAKWKEMDTDAKSEWEDKARADKERYEEEMAAYKAKARQEAAAAAGDSDEDSDDGDDE